MEINSARPAATEVASTTAAASEQAGRFTQRKAIEAQSDVKSDAVYFSPVIKIDRETQSAVIQYRDRETGEVKNEYPDPKQVTAYEQAQKAAPKQEEAPVEEVKVAKAETGEVKEPEPVRKEEPVKAEAPAVDEQA